MGYGSALKTGFKNCKSQWIFQTDGDAEYDVNDLKKLIKLTNKSELIITYRFKKKYTTSRIIISWIYNALLRVLFLTNFKDISTGSRLIKKKMLKKIKLKSKSPFIGAELAIKSKYSGLKVSEVGIHTYPRTFGTGSTVSLKNIILTIEEMLKMYFSYKKIKMNINGLEKTKTFSFDRSHSAKFYLRDQINSEKLRSFKA